MEKMTLFSKEHVLEALRLVAFGCSGLLSPDDAKESLPKLPEELAKMTVSTIRAAKDTKEAIINQIIDKKLKDLL